MCSIGGFCGTALKLYLVEVRLEVIRSVPGISRYVNGPRVQLRPDQLLTHGDLFENGNIELLVVSFGGKHNIDVFANVVIFQSITQLCLNDCKNFWPIQAHHIEVPVVTIIGSRVFRRLTDVITMESITKFAWENRVGNFYFYYQLTRVGEISVKMIECNETIFLRRIRSPNFTYCKLRNFKVTKFTELPVELRNSETLLIVVLQRGNHHTCDDFRKAIGRRKIFTRVSIYLEWKSKYYR